MAVSSPLEKSNEPTNIFYTPAGPLKGSSER